MESTDVGIGGGDPWPVLLSLKTEHSVRMKQNAVPKETGTHFYCSEKSLHYSGKRSLTVMLTTDAFADADKSEEGEEDKIDDEIDNGVHRTGYP